MSRLTKCVPSFLSVVCAGVRVHVCECRCVCWGMWTGYGAEWSRCDVWALRQTPCEDTGSWTGGGVCGRGVQMCGWDLQRGDP